MPLTLVGTAGNDSIVGGVGDDVIEGGAGDDTLSGNIYGSDTLSGGPGADVFMFSVYQSPVQNESTVDVISDWESRDRLAFADGHVFGASYLEATASGFYTAFSLATQATRTGVNFVVVQVGADLLVFADSRNDDGPPYDAILIRDRTLDDIDASNFIALPVEALAPALPAAPVAGVGGAGGTMTGNMDLIHPAELLGAVIVEADDWGVELSSDAVHVIASGGHFTYVNNQLVGGVVGYLSFGFGLDTARPMALVLNSTSFPAAALTTWVVNDDGAGALSTILAGNDGISGRLTDYYNRQAPGDLIRGYAGDDHIEGQGGPDTIFGGPGNDVIYATAARFFSQPIVATTYLRGDEGNDYIVGGSGFDDINGNMGDDTASGGDGDDWVVGGKDNDLLFGDAGADIVYGNLGNDTCVGGGGNDLIRGGQGADMLWGEGGADWLSGDRGDDTISGGLGADTFHTFSGAGVDRVVDFNLAEGDRVQVDVGTAWTVRQVGADTVIDMGGGDEMILVGVQMSTLTGPWIFTL